MDGHRGNICIGRCPCCGKWRKLDGHHRLPKSRGGKDEDIMDVCRQCHTDIHSLGDDKFFKKYGKKKTEFIERRINDDK